MEVKARVKTSPCPFCGGEVKVKVKRSFTIPFWLFKCKKCGATVSFDNDECHHNPEKPKEYFERRAK